MHYCFKYDFLENLNRIHKIYFTYQAEDFLENSEAFATEIRISSNLQRHINVLPVAKGSTNNIGVVSTRHNIL